MLEALGRQRQRQTRHLDLQLAIHGMSVYGLVTVLAQLQAPPAAIGLCILTLGGASVCRWIERRWRLLSLDASA